jgi:nucleoside-diphosphate-sugar epimerase
MAVRSVLLTGTTGFIGRHMAAQLKKAGHHVVSLQRSTETVPGVDEILVVPEFDVDTVSTKLKNRNFDWLVHLAGYGVRPGDRDAERMFRINVGVTHRLVQEACAWPAKAVFIAGSGSEYDTAAADKPVTEDHPLECSRIYGASKAAGSTRALVTASAHDLPLAVGRIFGVFGPGEPPHRLLPTLFHALGRRERVALSAGTQKRDLLYVDDIIAAALQLIDNVEQTRTNVVVNVASGVPVTVRSFVEIACEEFGAPKSLLGFGDVPLRSDETMCFSGDPTRLMRLTGWRPLYDLRSGIRRSLEQFRNTH